MIRTNHMLCVGLLVACATAGSTEQRVEGAAGEYALSKTNPVEVCEPRGETEYLRRLVCPSGDPPAFERIGNVGPRSELPSLSEDDFAALLERTLAKAPLQAGEPDRHIVDAYRVRCGEQDVTVYLDMYHCPAGAAPAAPAGFTIRGR